MTILTNETNSKQPLGFYLDSEYLPPYDENYLTEKLALELVCLPTTISVDDFLTMDFGYRMDRCMYYNETELSSPVHELEVITSSPFTIRAAEIIDIESNWSDTWDWVIAKETGVIHEN